MRTLLLLSMSTAWGCQEPLNVSLPDPAERPSTPATLIPTTLAGQELRAVGYNVESGDAEADTVAMKVEEVRGEVLWGFTETEDQSWLDTFATAADDGGQDFQSILGTTGYSDRIGILYDDTVVELIGFEELHSINIGNARAPLVAELEVRASGARFLLMVNHLWRTNAENRRLQAERLNAWIGEQPLPVVAIGDYNFDWAVVDGENDHDVAYDEMVAGGAWGWVRPADLIPTQCSPFYQSVLDFAFVGGAARSWPAVSDILFRPNVNCSDDAFKSDHRPVDIVFMVPDP